MPYLNGEILLGDQDVYVYGLYTAPEFRKCNISMALTKAYTEHFQARGYSRLLAAVMPENPAGIRAFGKGRRRSGMIDYNQLGKWRILLTVSPPAPTWEPVYRRPGGRGGRAGSVEL